MKISDLEMVREHVTTYLLLQLILGILILAWLFQFCDSGLLLGEFFVVGCFFFYEALEGGG